MKRIYDYHTGKLIKESANTLGKNRLYEGASFDVDIIENAKSVYRAQSNYNSRVLYLKKLVLSPSEKPIAIWEFTGNFCAREIEKICDAAGLDYCSVSAKSLRGSIKDIYDNEECYKNFPKGEKIKNHPESIIFLCDKFAELKQLSSEEFRKIILNNCYEIFKSITEK